MNQEQRDFWCKKIDTWTSIKEEDRKWMKNYVQTTAKCSELGLQYFEEYVHEKSQVGMQK